MIAVRSLPRRGVPHLPCDHCENRRAVATVQNVHGNVALYLCQDCCEEISVELFVEGGKEYDINEPKKELS